MSSPDSKAYLWFRIAYAFLTLNFLLPALSYIVAPDFAASQFSQINTTLGGPPLANPGSIHLWHMLGVGNVATLAFMCALIWVNVRKYYSILPSLLFLKGFSAVYSLGIFLATTGKPAFLFVFFLDGITATAIWFFARLGLRHAPA